MTVTSAAQLPSASRHERVRVLPTDASEGFDRPPAVLPPSDVYSCLGGFVFDEGGYCEGGYEGGSFGDDGAGA